MEDRATLASDLSAIRRLYSRAERSLFCPLASALLVVQKAINANSRSISVCTIGKCLLDRFTIETATILSPGVVLGWGFGLPQFVIQGLAGDHFRLALWLLVDRVIKGLVFVEDGDLSLPIFAHSDRGFAHGVSGP